MQNNPPQAPAIPNPTASCGLATASLVCGICGVILGPLTGIPAIITGHMALGRIKRSGDVLQGHGMAIAGLIMGYIFTTLIPILAVASVAAGNAAIKQARRTSCLATAMALESSVNNFYSEYGSMPRDGSSDVTVKTDTDTAVLKELLGVDGLRNTRGIKFLSRKDGWEKGDALIYDPSGGSVLGLYDPWGGGYQVRLDLDGDEKLDVIGEVLDGRRVAVWSDGPDRKAGTKDDVKTW
ncbi:MAG: DUF4190 domain-containing protein [Luteolibacter sp.]